MGVPSWYTYKRTYGCSKLVHLQKKIWVFQVGTPTKEHMGVPSWYTYKRKYGCTELVHLQKKIWVYRVGTPVKENDIVASTLFIRAFFILPMYAL
jgi:hypothetical protein